MHSMLSSSFKLSPYRHSRKSAYSGRAGNRFGLRSRFRTSRNDAVESLYEFKYLPIRNNEVPISKEKYYGKDNTIERRVYKKRWTI